ncbi:MAG: sigma 54-interacting transcriptional regulator, partial [Polyangiaceae bacterium]|nr:sigma 54-interacting transcriptional regulator [Polyangiaceae bacterium]
MLDLPSRYEPLARLGAGGGGEVWSVRDRVTGDRLALKVLARTAGTAEVDALVREAVALSGLEGLGVPRVVAFGTIGQGRTYMVRELVEGRSLDEVLGDRSDPGRERARRATSAIASACDQLTVIHRAGLLHGDVKPANIIVGHDGRATLVDLGLAAPWREGGTAARGLTPRYAAPELLSGETLTVRAEVYAIGATLSEAMEHIAGDLDEAARVALASVASRATEQSPARRWPSVDEFASALRAAAGLPAHTPTEAPWPLIGADGIARALLERVRSLCEGGAMAVEGASGSGRTTLVRRVAWTLGAEGRPVAFIEAPRAGLSMGDAVTLELERAAPTIGSAVVVIDDAARLDDAARAALGNASRAGARLVVVGPLGMVAPLAVASATAFAVPPLAGDVASMLVQRAIPSLPDSLRDYLVARAGQTPAALRRAVRALAGRPIVGEDDVDRALDDARSRFDPAPATDSQRALDEAERALERGRFDDAARALGSATPRGNMERARHGLSAARIATGRGDATKAIAELDRVERAAAATGQSRAWKTLRARAILRAGRYAEAAELALSIAEASADDACAVDALCARGVALSFTGDDASARATLERAVSIARSLGDSRVTGVALGSSAIAHQRAGRQREARADYEAALSAAERAQDAGTIATTRLNLAALAQGEGEIGAALMHLEAAVDMGMRAGMGSAVTQALLNLASLDLYLGRWARARSSIDRLAAARDELSPAAQTQLLGLEAEHAERTGQSTRASSLYEETARAWQAQGRTHDAAESRLEGLLSRARSPGVDPHALSRELDAIQTSLGAAGTGEHMALFELVRGAIAQAASDEEGARRAFDAAIDAARAAGRREWAWQALDARARLATAQGAIATARRDSEAALALLEETAAKLPRDLREVFWDDPRRRALRQAVAPSTPIGALSPGHGAAPLLPASGTSGARSATSLFTGRLAEDRLARILELTRELASEHDMERLLSRVTDHAVALLGAERGFVLLVGDRGVLETHTARTRTGGDDPHALFSRSVAEKVVETGEPVLTVSARDDQRLAHAVSVHQLMIQSIACVPIRGAPPVGRTIGALYVETRLRPEVRFEREMPTLGAFADQAAIAIENARLIAENRARADDLARANTELASARDELARTLGKRTEQLAEARRDLKQVRAELRSHFGYAGLVGTSASMRRLYALIERVKDTDVPLLVTGESGTGKEIVARAVHQAGPRAKKTFVGVNCGAIPANLLESELFGSVKGAFTGADRDRPGVLRETDGGTLLLDE